MPPDPRPILFFDIDNCLYPRSALVQDHMAALIDRYFSTHLSLTPSSATLLHRRYYTDYGLAISGLVKHHQIDPLEYNKEVDDALPLDDLIKPDKRLRRLLEGVDRGKVKLWLFTNAYVTHARRVVGLLGVEDLFEGVTFCDYARVPLVAKPHGEMFEKAEREAGVWEGGTGGGLGEAGRRKCYFVDDSALNCRHAMEREWTVVHKVEEGDPELGATVANYRVKDLEELRQCFPKFFKEGGGGMENGTRANGSSL